MTLTELLELKEILSTDSMSTTRLTTNSNFKVLRKAIIELIDTLGVNEDPSIEVDSVEAADIVANNFATPKPLGGTYNFTVNANGEIVCKSVRSNVVMTTARLRLELNADTDAFQEGELRWNGTDLVVWDGATWASLTAKNEPSGETNTGSNLGTGAEVFKVKDGVDLKFRTIVAGSGVTINSTSNEISISSGAISGFSGFSGGSGFSGAVGSQGATGQSGTSGFSGQSGTSGSTGLTGTSGFSGNSGFSGRSGFSGFSGTNGTNGSNGSSGFSGYSGLSGFSGSGPVTANANELVIGAGGSSTTSSSNLTFASNQLTLLAGQRLKVTSYSSPTGIADSDFIVFSNGVVLQLPESPSNGKTYIIKNIHPGATARIQTSGGKTINGMTELQLGPNAVTSVNGAMVVYNTSDTDWKIVLTYGNSG